MKKAGILQGLKIANNILLEYNTQGLLFGGVLSRLFNKQSRNRPRDIDILVLSPSCENHPERMEGTKYDFDNRGDAINIDWWVYHADSKYPIQRPSNDNVVAAGEAAEFVSSWIIPNFDRQVGLYWNAHIKKGVKLSPGLYVPEPPLAKKIIKTELPKISDSSLRNRKAAIIRRKQTLKLEEQLYMAWDKKFYSLQFPLISEEELEIIPLDKDMVMSNYCKHQYVTK